MEPQLTPRQSDVLGRIARGWTIAEIAEDLGIGFETVKMHVSDILAELGVRSRDEAAEWWRRRPVHNREPAPVRQRTMRLVGAGLATAAALAGIAFAVAVVMSRDNSDEPASAVTLDSVIAAMTRPGQVFVTTYENDNGGSAESTTVWFDPEALMARQELSAGGELSSAFLFLPGSQYSLLPGDPEPQQSGWSSPLPSAYAALIHLQPWLIPGGPQFEGSDTIDGRDVKVFSSETDGFAERAPSRYRVEVAVESSSLLPIRVRLYSSPAGGVPQLTTELRFTERAFVDRTRLPADHFEPEALTPSVNFPSAGGMLAQLPFTAYWFGGSFDLPGFTVQGTDAQYVLQSAQSGQSFAEVRYRLDGGEGRLLTVISAPAGAFPPESGYRFEIATTHEATEAIGAGTLYWGWDASPGCTFEDGYVRDDCRNDDGKFYALNIEKNGVRVIVFTSGEPPSLNPANSREGMLTLTGMLRPAR